MKSKKKNNRKTILAVVAVVAVAAIAFAIVTRPKADPYDEIAVQTGDIATYYSFTGVVSAIDSQVLYADKALQIRDILVAEGEVVQSGEVLLTTTAGEDITAPISGTVSTIFVDKNEQQMPGTQLCRIVDYDNLELEISVDEYDLSAMSIGKVATIRLHALDEEVDGKVTWVAREGTTLNGVTFFKARISLETVSGLRVGMSAQAQVLNESAVDVALLPLTAIQFDSDNQGFVYLDDGNGQPDRTDVALGLSDGRLVEIQEGLEGADMVLIPSVRDTANGFSGFGGMRDGETE